MPPSGPQVADSANWLLQMAYEGTGFHGWARQPGQRTVQGELEDALAALFQTAIPVAGCSRTDAGVHALQQCATVIPPPAPAIPAAAALRALNGRLPGDLRLLAIEPRPAGFHARADAVGKRYVYVLNCGSRSPFLDRWSWWSGQALDMAAIGAAAAAIPGTWDFTPFTVSGGTADADPVKTITGVTLHECHDLLTISFTGNAFLYKMVRRLTGFLVAVGQRRLPPGRARELLTGSAPPTIFDTAPPNGLFLRRIFYSVADMAAPVPRELPFLPGAVLAG